MHYIVPPLVINDSVIHVIRFLFDRQCLTCYASVMDVFLLNHWQTCGWLSWVWSVELLVMPFSWVTRPTSFNHSTHHEDSTEKRFVHPHQQRETNEWTNIWFREILSSFCGCLIFPVLIQMIFPSLSQLNSSNKLKNTWLTGNSRETCEQESPITLSIDIRASFSTRITFSTNCPNVYERWVPLWCSWCSMITDHPGVLLLFWMLCPSSWDSFLCLFTLFGESDWVRDPRVRLPDDNEILGVEID
jgi:hypothetical protein